MLLLVMGTSLGNLCSACASYGCHSGQFLVVLESWVPLWAISVVLSLVMDASLGIYLWC